MPRKYSSKKDLKSLAMRFAEKNNLDGENIEKFLIEVDRLKSGGNLSDQDILIRAFNKLYNQMHEATVNAQGRKP